jgi:NADPH:quinone reductase-like Zn-dependent oxidoreductase
MVKRAVFGKLGPAEEVAELEDVPYQDPGPKEVSVLVKASSINPADFLRCLGQLGPISQFPSPMGGEGVGIIDKVGSEVQDLQIGDVVLLPNGVCWTEQLICRYTIAFIRYLERFRCIIFSLYCHVVLILILQYN